MDEFFWIGAFSFPLLDQLVKVLGLQPGVRSLVLVDGHQPQRDRAQRGRRQLLVGPLKHLPKRDEPEPLDPLVVGRNV